MDQTIGTRDNAEAVYRLLSNEEFRWCRKAEGETYSIEDDPEFTYLGHGIERAAFLGPDGVVYKGPMSLPRFDGYSQQHTERESLEEWREAGFDWVPPTTMWFDGEITSMPHYEQPWDNPGSLIDWMQHHADVDNLRRFVEINFLSLDTHGNNIGLDENGRIFIIDAGVADPYHEPYERVRKHSIEIAKRWFEKPWQIGNLRFAAGESAA